MPLEGTTYLKQLELSWRHFCTQKVISSLSLEQSNVQARVLFDQAEEQMVLQITTVIAGHRVEEYQWPENWFEGLKERFFPSWLRRRFPIKYVRIKIDALFPWISNEEKNPVIAIYDSRDGAQGGYPYHEDEVDDGND